MVRESNADPGPQKRVKIEEEDEVTVLGDCKQEISDEEETKTKTLIAPPKNLENDIVTIRVAGKILGPVGPVVVALKIENQRKEVITQYCKAIYKKEFMRTRTRRRTSKELKKLLFAGYKHVIVCSDCECVYKANDPSYASQGKSCGYDDGFLTTLFKFDSYKIKFDMGNDMKELNKQASKKLEEAISNLVTYKRSANL